MIHNCTSKCQKCRTDRVTNSYFGMAMIFMLIFGTFFGNKYLLAGLIIGPLINYLLRWNRKWWEVREDDY